MNRVSANSVLNNESRVDLFTAFPTSGLAETCHYLFRAKAIQSLTSLLFTAKKALKLDGLDAQGIVSSIDLKQKFSPGFYAHLWNLNKAIQDKDPQQTVQNLEKFLGYWDSLYPGQGLKIETLGNDVIQEGVLEYANSPDALRGDGVIPKMEAIEGFIFDENKEIAAKAVKLIAEIDPIFSEEISEYVSLLRLFDGKVIRGLTSVRVFGSIHLRIPETKDYAEQLCYYVDHITHETSHLHLHTFMAEDPLVLNHPSERFKAPIRVDLRPMRGIYHAVFVLSRIVMILGKLYEQDSNNIALGNFLRDSSRKFSSGYEVVRRHGKLSDNGEAILATAYDMASPWLLK